MPSGQTNASEIAHEQIVCPVNLSRIAAPIDTARRVWELERRAEKNSSAAKQAAFPARCKRAGKVSVRPAVRGTSPFIYRGTDQIGVEIQHKDRLLADQGAIEDVLAVENDVVPFDRADMVPSASGALDFFSF